MSDTFVIELDATAALRNLAEAARRTEDLSPVMLDIGELLLESTRARFASSVAPDGTPWLPLRDGSGRRPLLLTGTMSRQIFPSSGRNFVELSATQRQARYHQFGTAPYTIEPRGDGPLAFSVGGRKVFAKRVNHPGLPARPFLGVSDADAEAIDKLAGEYLADAFLPI